MDTPIAAVLWTNQAQRDMQAVLRLMSHVERCCLEAGSEEAASLVAAAISALLRDSAARKRAA